MLKHVSTLCVFLMLIYGLFDLNKYFFLVYKLTCLEFVFYYIILLQIKGMFMMKLRLYLYVYTYTFSAFFTIINVTENSTDMG